MRVNSQVRERTPLPWGVHAAAALPKPPPSPGLRGLPTVALEQAPPPTAEVQPPPTPLLQPEPFDQDTTGLLADVAVQTGEGDLARRCRCLEEQLAAKIEENTHVRRLHAQSELQLAKVRRLLRKVAAAAAPRSGEVAHNDSDSSCDNLDECGESPLEQLYDDVDSPHRQGCRDSCERRCKDCAVGEGLACGEHAGQQKWDLKLTPERVTVEPAEELMFTPEGACQQSPLSASCARRENNSTMSRSPASLALPPRPASPVLSPTMPTSPASNAHSRIQCGISPKTPGLSDHKAAPSLLQGAKLPQRLLQSGPVTVPWTWRLPLRLNSPPPTQPAAPRIGKATDRAGIIPACAATRLPARSFGTDLTNNGRGQTSKGNDVTETSTSRGRPAMPRASADRARPGI